jgi:HD-GYP domain-containing protein (c-di-GMP phosphodiesterase class II)
MTEHRPAPTLCEAAIQRLALQSLLEDTFDAPFALAQREADAWRPATIDSASADSLPPFTDDLQQALQMHFQETDPVVTRRADGQHLVIVPLHGKTGAPMALWAYVPIAEEPIVRRLLKSAFLLVEERKASRQLKACLKECAQQVTADFEELTWLRELASHIDLCDSRRETVELADAVLPALKEIINAEALLLLQRIPGDAQSEQEFKTVLTLGTLTLSDEQCGLILRELGPAAGEQPVVRNSTFGSELISEREASLQNLLLVHVGRGEDQFGWLLAVNKIFGAPGVSDTAFHDAKSCGAAEFGTSEAATLNAAAVLLGTHSRNLKLLQERESLFLGITKALINAIDAKDTYTCGHSDRVAHIGRRIALQMQLPPQDCERIYLAGLLHDIGKIGVPDDVLLKPGKLSDEEFAFIKKHPEIGYGILKHVPQLAYVFDGVLHHHESYDGKGYPARLAGEQIPLIGRILAVADAYDAMTSNRPYRPGMTTERAEEILSRGAGQQWDPQVIAAFFGCVQDVRRLTARSTAALDGIEDALVEKAGLDSLWNAALQHGSEAVPPLATLVPI